MEVQAPDKQPSFQKRHSTLPRSPFLANFRFADISVPVGSSAVSQRFADSRSSKREPFEGVGKPLRQLSPHERFICGRKRVRENPILHSPL